MITVYNRFTRFREFISGKLGRGDNIEQWQFLWVSDWRQHWFW